MNGEEGDGSWLVMVFLDFDGFDFLLLV